MSNLGDTDLWCRASLAFSVTALFGLGFLKAAWRQHAETNQAPKSTQIPTFRVAAQ